MLKKKVLVNGISNLSDARYCAGMFVDYLSFELNTSHPDYISIEKILEIKNWLSGIKIGGRVTDWPEEITKNQWEELNFDFLIIEKEEFKVRSKGLVPELFYQISEFQEIDLATFDHILMDIEMANNNSIEHHSIFAGPNVNVESLESILELNNVDGIALKGSHEIRPGESTYEDLMDVLEALETEE